MSDDYVERAMTAAANHNQNQTEGLAELWEIGCAPNSRLTESSEKAGLKAKQINIQYGYDPPSARCSATLSATTRRTRH